MLPTEFFSTYSNIKYINLSFSKLLKIADFTFAVRTLIELNLRGNELISLSLNIFNGAHELQTIDLSENHISFIHPDTFLNLHSLSTLNLANNKIDNNTFGRNGNDWTDTIESLKRLDLSNNSIRFYDMMPYQAFSGLVNLESLNLRHNQINLDYGAFSSNSHLKTLDFSFNSMTYFDLNFLLSVASLENLYLHGNGLQYASQIDLGGIRAVFPSLKSLGISENSFSCEVLATIIKKTLQSSIQLVIDEGKFVNNRRNLRGISCV
jgi:hypothetical protein